MGSTSTSNKNPSLSIQLQNNRHYVIAATQFAQWAFSSPVERAEEVRRRGVIEVEVSKNARAASLLSLETSVAGFAVPSPALQMEIPPEGVGLAFNSKQVGFVEGVSSHGRMNQEVEEMLRRNAELLASLRSELDA